MVDDVGTESKIALPRLPEAPRMARTFVRDTFGFVGDDMLDRITLCVSELVTNAIDHAAPPIELSLAASDEHVRVEVRDASDDMPVTRELSPSSLRGRGMYLVANAATAWGVEPLPCGKSVWAQFSLRTPPR